MDPILFAIDAGVAIITLNRPDKLNSFIRQMALDLQDRLDDCKAAEVRAVYITGAGKAFSAGQDLAEVVNPEGPGMSRILSEHYNPIILKIRQLEKPVIAAVNGVAAGAGANIAFCCDVIVASQSAVFIQAFSKIGLVPDSGGTYFLPRLIGWQKASALMMLGDKVSATEAERLGMVYKILEDTTFPEESLNIARTMANMPTRGLAYTKQLLEKSFSNDLGKQLEVEDKLQQLAGATSDFKEGTLAFLEKRSPRFKGE
jgi:2-(1,2-epoxy-1,2-dihydrophenyl)acetyl-CoA isomerase